MRGNTSISGVLSIIKGQIINGVDRKDCHGVVSSMILKRKDSSDILLLLGFKNSVFHSVLVSDNSSIIADSYIKSLSSYDIDSGNFIYTKNGIEFTLNVIYRTRVGNI